MMGEAVDTVFCAFAFAAGVGVNDETAVPPIVNAIINPVMDDAVTKGGGENFADDWVVDDVGGAAGRAIGAVEEGVAEIDEISSFVDFEFVFVESATFSTATGFVVGNVEFEEELVFWIFEPLFIVFID